MILIISCGNSFRRDDGAGFVLGEKIEKALLDRCHRVQRIAVHQLTPELAEPIAGEEVLAVIFTDTRAAGPGDSLRLQFRPVPSCCRSQGLGHTLSAGEVMAYAHRLYGKGPPAWVATVPGVDFEHGEGLSPVSLAALNEPGDPLHCLPPDWPLGPAGTGAGH